MNSRRKRALSMQQMTPAYLNHADVSLPNEYFERSKYLAETLVNDMIWQYAQSQAQASTVKVDKKEWKLFKEKNGFQCYRRRRLSRTKSKGPQTPDLLATGQLHGQMDDILLGTVHRTVLDMKMASAYTHDKILDARILAHIVRPVASNPFRSVTIKWVLKKQTGLTRPRDYLYLESTGVIQPSDIVEDGKNTTMMSNKQYIGYHLIHSISVPEVPEQPKTSQVIRGNMYACFLYRQLSQSIVEVYYQGNVHPQGSIREGPSLSVGVDLVLTATTLPQVANIKKLAYQLHANGKKLVEAAEFIRESMASPWSNDLMSPIQQRPTATIDKNFLAAASRLTAANMTLLEDPNAKTQETLWEAREDNCTGCGRAFGAFVAKAQCHLCLSYICARCRIAKRLYVMTPSQTLSPYKLEFCFTCLAHTNAISATVVASEEVKESNINDVSSPIYQTNSADLGKKCSGSLPSRIDGRSKSLNTETSHAVDSSGRLANSNSSNDWRKLHSFAEESMSPQYPEVDIECPVMDIVFSESDAEDLNDIIPEVDSIHVHGNAPKC